MQHKPVTIETSARPIKRGSFCMHHLRGAR